jgi:hypothetical protein
MNKIRKTYSLGVAPIFISKTGYILYFTIFLSFSRRNILIPWIQSRKTCFMWVPSVAEEISLIFFNFLLLREQYVKVAAVFTAKSHFESNPFV